jgi:peptide/nickel transport system permease protein
MRCLTRRFLFYLAAACIAITINFFIPRLMAGDPVQVMIAQFQGRLDPRGLQALRETFGFVQGPLPEQFVTYLGNLLHGNMGISISSFPVPVTTVIAGGLAWTLRLIGVAAVVSFGIGIMLGILAAWRRGRFTDSVILPIASLMGAFPFFWIAMLALYIFAFVLGWFPIGHAYDINIREPSWTDPAYVNSVVHHALLPLITIVITAIGGWMLGMRNNMISVLAEDYIVLAQAKGLSDRRVMLTYAARNAILPSLTAFAMNLGFVIGGALVVEMVFAYPGMGFILLNAVRGRDYMLMQGVFLMITLAVLVANFIADITYVLMDPRAR